MWKLFSGFLVVNLVRGAVLNNGERVATLDTPGLITSNGYPVERHQLVTKDGYNLEMHRIPRGKDQVDSSDRPAVFLMHGLTSSSISFIAVGPEVGVAYNLADAGFDVWMGNSRGNAYSRSHTTLDPEDSTDKFQFFDFSFEELGMIDIPAMIDYVLAHTGKKQLHYIGHSQGGTAFFVMASMKPEYNDKLRSVHLLAGVGYQNYFPDEQFRQLATSTDSIYALALLFGVVEISPQDLADLVPNGQPDTKANVCAGNPNYSRICRMTGMDRLMNRVIPSDNRYGSASMKQIAHYGQNIRDKAFRRWNYGEQENQAIYGGDPPAYNLGLITARVTMHYTLGDILLDERDVLAMANDMPNTIVRKVARESFLHEDFVIAEDSKELVTNYIINEIWCAENSPGCDRLPDSSSSIVLNVLLKVFILVYSLKIIIRS